MLLTLNERDRRWSALQAAMRVEGLDAVIACMTDARGQKGAFRFLSDERPFHRFGYVVMPARGEPVMVLHPVLGHAPRGLWVGDVRTPADVGGELVQTVRDMGAARVGLIGADQGMRLGDHAALRAMNGIRFSSADALFEDVRAIKSAEEIEGLEEAAGIADECFAAMLDLAQPALTERGLSAHLSALALAAGADELLFLTMSAATDGCRSIIRAPADVELGASGSFIFSIELSGPSGFWVELARIVSFGNAYMPMRPVADLCHASVRSGIDALRLGLTGPGAVGADVQAALEAPLDPADYDVAPASGHAIGHDVIEHPVIGRSATDGPLLRDGMAFAMHPMFRHRHRAETAYVADTYAIAGGSPRRLSRWPLEHFILPR